MATSTTRVEPPPPLPSFETAWRIRAEGLPEGAYPCTTCWGKGCKVCKRKGTGPYSEFARWYAALACEHRRRVALWEAAQDRVKKNIVGRDYYDLAWLRMSARSEEP